LPSSLIRPGPSRFLYDVKASIIVDFIMIPSAPVKECATALGSPASLFLARIFLARSRRGPSALVLDPPYQICCCSPRSSCSLSEALQRELAGSPDTTQHTFVPRRSRGPCMTFGSMSKRLVLIHQMVDGRELKGPRCFDTPHLGYGALYPMNTAFWDFVAWH